MSDDQIVAVKPDIAARAHVSASRYAAMRDQAAADPDTFWAGQLDRVAWSRRPTQIKNASFTGNVDIK